MKFSYFIEDINGRIIQKSLEEYISCIEKKTYISRERASAILDEVKNDIFLEIKSGEHLENTMWSFDDGDRKCVLVSYCGDNCSILIKHIKI